MVGGSVVEFGRYGNHNHDSGKARGEDMAMRGRGTRPSAAGTDLAGLAAETDALLGRETGLADLVMRHSRAKATLEFFDKGGQYRAAVDASAARLVASMPSVVTAGWRGKALAVQVQRGGGGSVLRAARVRQASPRLWEASKVPVVMLTAGGGLEAGWKPYAPVPAAAVDRVYECLEVMAEKRKAATAVVNEVRPALLDIVDELELARREAKVVRTTDGWTFGWKVQMRFNAARCRELAPRYNVGEDQLAGMVEVTQGWVSTAYRLVNPKGEGGEAGGD